MTKPKVEIRPAHVWTCDNCGQENFERCVVVELSPEEKAELEENELGAQTGDWMTIPESVTCKSCNSEFETQDFHDET